MGIEWGFQVRCQKYSKHAKLKCNNWESDNYNRMVNTADEEEMFEQEGNSGRTRRCIYSSNSPLFFSNEYITECVG